ncbi:putative membrane protein [Bradyrhizobium sp. JR1.5]|jgi:uncharacterized membrane protein|uniref:DUF2231 domain-containing protein n=1 Tax=unclassified Bradyrhizobium TaxID=2631580 RepID=UPI0033959C5A
MPEIIPNWHPVFVHFTIALYVVATALYGLGQIARGRSWAGVVVVAARINLWTGAALSILTVIAGINAFFTVAHDASQTIFMTDHRRWAIATAVIWWFIAVLEAGRTAQGKKAHLVIALALVAAIGPLAVTGWKGAELVYRNGIGIVATLGSVPR